MKTLLAAAAVALIPLTAAPAWAEPRTEKDSHALANDGIQSLLKAMEMMLLAIPQYEAPTVNENGDIIIRRKNPPPKADQPAPQPEGKRKSI